MSWIDLIIEANENKQRSEEKHFLVNISCAHISSSLILENNFVVKAQKSRKARDKAKNLFSSKQNKKKKWF